MKQMLTRAEWDALRYPIEVQTLSQEEGSGWIAWIPLLGRGLFMADGATVAEAIERLEALRRESFELVVGSGRPVPLPDDATDQPLASGKWLQRASRKLHAEMRAAAEREGVSFNSYCESALLRGHTMLAADVAMGELADRICESRAKLSPVKKPRKPEAKRTKSPRRAAAKERAPAGGTKTAK